MDEPENRNNRYADLIARIARIEHALTVLMLAEILSCSNKQLYKLIDEGRMPSYRVGSLIRLCPQEIAEWLNTHRIEAQPRKKRISRRHRNGGGAK